MKRTRTRLIVTLPFLEEKPAYVDRWVHEVYPHAYLVSPRQVPTSKFPYNQFRKVIVDANLFRGVYRLLVPVRFDRAVILAHPLSLGAAVNGLLSCARTSFEFQVDVLERGLPETLPRLPEGACTAVHLLRLVRGFDLDSMFVRTLVLGGRHYGKPSPDPRRRPAPRRDVVPTPRPRKATFNPALDLSLVHQEES